MARYMPAFDAYLHYRIVDVSTLKELAKRWNPDVLAGRREGRHATRRSPTCTSRSRSCATTAAPSCAPPEARRADSGLALPSRASARPRAAIRASRVAAASRASVRLERRGRAPRARRSRASSFQKPTASPAR